ncbi:glycosyltransferase [Microbacterium invictum]|uniref:glycosyltransferase n=1 Tax=Microbacterium invictum TaxID=515415 RepID=UPI003A100135
MSDSVSVVITVLNEGASVSEWLDSLARQTLLPDELVVCDGGSTDATLNKIRGLADSLPFSVTLIEEPGANISRGRNIAIDHASSQWIAVSDAGTHLQRDWLENLTAQRSGADVVAGFFKPTGSTPFRHILSAAITPLLREIDPAKFLPSSRSVLFRKDCWASVGGYPEWLDYCEDLVFDVALLKHEFVFRFAPHAIVTWDGRDNLRAFFMQYYRYARGDGKAGLWFGRHLARYSSYALGILMLVASARRPLLVAPLIVGSALHFSKPAKRLISHAGLPLMRRILGLVLVPVIVLTGDVAKMIGYPVGVAWRRRQ